MSYHTLEAGLLCLALLASLWGALRFGAPRLSLALSQHARRLGLPEALIKRIFGEASSCQSACSRCGGCEKTTSAQSATQPITRHIRREP